ncbi:hypothetical protein [Nonomuraea sp. NPDC050540]|uniref:hypothetical protein n=1 Tax=Nonomuraea sp. NPDC050540 TaxID=3364367 RepID=UPI00378E1945
MPDATPLDGLARVPGGDTYTSVFPQVAMAAAEKTAALLLGDDHNGATVRQLHA